MTDHDCRSLAELEEQVERSDPRFARALGSGRPYPPREYRHGRAWLVLVVAGALFVTGALLPQGLLIATAIVVGGVAGHMFAKPSAGPRLPRSSVTPPDRPR
jgi:DUF3040 family protein